MKVAAITDAVRGTGYHSSSINFRGIVNQALIKDDRFTSPSRGLVPRRSKAGQTWRSLA